ncbi:MAG: endonuclease/exonuclease/phosphatase family protein [Pseudomonadota bacterium]|nr:endonuclease/exonuclease/phosphatase family protein [Pseudomonadota bacterium]
MRLRAVVAVALLLASAGCATLPPERSTSCAEAPRPAVRLSEDGATATVQLDVLTYNIEGLSWPARGGRAASLAAIAERLRQLRETGQAPHVILFQEAFSRAASRAVHATGYPNIAAGPRRSENRGRREGPSLPGRRRPHRGEVGLKLATGGLAIASEYPIVAITSEPFPRRSCAGLDCLSNKGVLHAEIAIPGLPGTLHLLNTHMNSAGASRVPARRHHAAHREQTRFIAGFLDEVVGFGHPLIFGGDFNMRHSELRFDTFERAQPLEVVHRYCMDPANGCDVRMSWDGDAPWMDTQDLQLFWSTPHVSVRPVRVEAMFDGGPSGPRLSDHDGFRVVYELSWDPRRAEPAPFCPA